MNRILIIGGGAAGMLAAGQAAASGAEVVLLEKMQRPGRKIAISGKGRCNITNVADLPDFIEHFGKQGRFLHQPFSRFFAPELIKFLKQRQLAVTIERGGRVFPTSGKAVDVLNVFLDWLKQLRVSIKPSSHVEKLLVSDGRIQGVLCNDRKITGDTVILATGGTIAGTAESGTQAGYDSGQIAIGSMIDAVPGLTDLAAIQGIDR